MIIIIGLVILIAAVVTGVAGVLSNSGSEHALTHPFAVLGYHVTGSTGTLFLYGIVVGALALLGLSLLLAGARRTSRRGREARRGLTQSRRETAAAAQDRDDLLDQRETARAYTASMPGNAAIASGRDPTTDAGAGPHGKWHLFGSRPTSQQAATPPVQAANGPVPDVPANADQPAQR
ncbi:MAG TPA: hypothetical protein VFW50_17930 [Streptosporangiaceae bacterium]|nr:hypothetical protein [Streptosporangiaceae bacterium]